MSSYQIFSTCEPLCRHVYTDSLTDETYVSRSSARLACVLGRGAGPQDDAQSKLDRVWRRQQRGARWMHNFCPFVDNFLEVVSNKSGGGGGGEEGAREGGSNIDSLPWGYADFSRALFLCPISPPLCSFPGPAQVLMVMTFFASIHPYGAHDDR